jgi:hypothetical protein
MSREDILKLAAEKQELALKLIQSIIGENA